MKKDQHGYIVVETIGAFMLFVFFVASILMLINIVAVQARVHNAITQAAETVSMYSYILDLTGVSDFKQGVAGRADKAGDQAQNFANNIDAVVSGIRSLSPSQIQGGIEGASDQAQQWLDDPKEFLSLASNFGIEQLTNAGFGALIRPLIGHYLKNGSVSRDEYLRRMQVIDGLDGLSFYQFDLSNANDSTLINASGDLIISVEYATASVCRCRLSRSSPSASWCGRVRGDTEAATAIWRDERHEGFKGTQKASGRHRPCCAAA